MIASVEELVRELAARGVDMETRMGDAPGPRVSERPWYIGLLLGVSGWVAGLFSLVFIFMLLELRSSVATLIIGSVLVGTAWAMYRIDSDGPFVSQLALALSVAGQFALLFGVHDLLFKRPESLAGIAFAAFVLELALIVVIPNRLHRAMSTLFACFAWALCVRYGLWDELPFRRAEGARAARSLPLALVGWALAWLPVAWVLQRSIRREPAWIAAQAQAMMRPVCNGLITGLAIATLLSYPLETFAWAMAANPEPSRNWLAVWPLLSAFAALAALAAAVAFGSRGLAVVCIVAALFHVSHFYYAMGISLLAKSVTMLVLGALLLGIAHRMKGERAA